MEDRAKTARRNNAPHKAIVRKKDSGGRERATRPKGLGNDRAGEKRPPCRLARQQGMFFRNTCFQRRHKRLFFLRQSTARRAFFKENSCALERKYISKNSLAEAENSPSLIRADFFFREIFVAKQEQAFARRPPQRRAGERTSPVYNTTMGDRNLFS